jgi:hypothetical protein
MPKSTELDKKFVAHLQRLGEDRAALAVLRQGLGQPPGTTPQMYPYVEPWFTVCSPSSARGEWYHGTPFCQCPQAQRE